MNPQSKAAPGQEIEVGSKKNGSGKREQ